MPLSMLSGAARGLSAPLPRPPPPDLGSAPRESWKALAYGAAGAAIFASLLLEQLGFVRSGPLLRALVVAIGLGGGGGAWRLPGKSGVHRKLVWLSVWLLPVPNCAPAAGVQVDVWHCDAAGLYSDEAANTTVGKKFLRGYQPTDTNGAVRFVTIYPGWYRGRTIHIHIRVRTFNGSAPTYNFTSQLFFDETISAQVLAQSPYNTRGTRDTTNATDNIYTAATLLALTNDGSGYMGTLDVTLNGVPAVTGTPTPTASPTPISTPNSCVGDCDGSGTVTVDELVKGVNIGLGNVDVNTCPQFDADGGGTVTVDELVTAVNAALNGCGGG